MSNHTTDARPYAKALFELAVEKQTLANWGDVLAALALALSNADIKAMIDDPMQDGQVVVDTLLVVAAKACASLEGEARNLLMLLNENKRFNALVDIDRLFLDLKAEHENKINVHVTSASELTDTQKQHMQEKLQKRFATDVEVDYSVDAELVGGAVIQAGNWVMDGSIKGKIARLNEDLVL